MTTPNITTKTYTVPANGSAALFREAEFLTCLDATAPFQVKIDNGPKFDLEAGVSVAFPEGFKRVELIDTSGANNTIRVALGKGNVRDARFNLSGSVNVSSAAPLDVSAAPIREDVPDVLTTGAPVSALNAAATPLAAANTLRRELILVNEDAAATVYVGGASGALAGEGIPVLPGQSLTLQTSAAVYARNDSGAAVAVAVAEMEWSA